VAARPERCVRAVDGEGVTLTSARAAATARNLELLTVAPARNGEWDDITGFPHAGGHFEVHARVRSATHDPDPIDNRVDDVRDVPDPT